MANRGGGNTSRGNGVPGGGRGNGRWDGGSNGPPGGRPNFFEGGPSGTAGNGGNSGNGSDHSNGVFGDGVFRAGPGRPNNAGGGYRNQQGYNRGYNRNYGGNNFNRRPYNSYVRRENTPWDTPDLSGLNDTQKQIVKEAAEAFARQLVASSASNGVNSAVNVPAVQDLVRPVVPASRTTQVARQTAVSRSIPSTDIALAGAGGDVVMQGRGEITGADTRDRGMALPFTALSITFDNIRYSVDMPQEMKDKGINEDRLLLLKGVSGAFRPGVLTALMGVSGAGKTTLMDVLAGRKTGGYIEGDISISGYSKNQETFARIAGYCEQNDIHSPHVTVYESLVYSAWLRLSPDVDSEARKMFVEQVMELVELASLRGALVGLPGVNGLSTEQRKRLTIAVELVANPSIIFMDEPTSGLDARAAAIVMRAVRNTVDIGRTVVCTIHQPSIDIFEAFDEGIQGVKKIKGGYNPAAWMLEVTTLAQEDALGVNFAEVYMNSDLYRRNKALISELSTPPPGSTDLYFPNQYAQSFFTQCIACLWKQHKSYWRNPSYTATRIFFTMVIALIFGTIFLNLGKKVDKRQDLFNSLGSMYAAVIFIGIQNGQCVQPIVDVERTVFYREKAAGMYSALPYAFAQVFIEIPHVFLQTLVYGLIVYSLIGLDWAFMKFFWYMFFMFFTFLYFTFYGMMAVAMTPNSDIAAIVATAFYAVWNIFAGFLVPRPRIPIWWRWYSWACPVAWTLYGLVASQYGDIADVRLEDGEAVDAFINRFFGFRHDYVGFMAIGVVGFTVLFAFVFAFSIKVFNFQRR
ncbi:hypothetical protein ACQ4PT_019042 [Festuca glaucescens]